MPRRGGRRGAGCRRTSARRGPAAKPEPDPRAWAKAKQRLHALFSKAQSSSSETWPALLLVGIDAFVLISQRTVIQHVLHKMSETFFELYIIALTDACVRHALLMGVARHRVGASRRPVAPLHLRNPVFYGTLLPLWFLLACWLLVCTACRSGRRIQCIALEELVMMRSSGDELLEGGSRRPQCYQ